MTEEALCRHCASQLTVSLADLGMSPVANDFVSPDRFLTKEPFYPLQVYVCSACRLAQLQDLLASTDIFREDYAYFSSFSTSWLEHANRYVSMMIERFRLDRKSKVVEIASNDGYLLQYFVEAQIDALGVEPSRSVAEAAIRKGIPTRVEFFGRALATTLRNEHYSADVMVANNVLAHVPDINDFVSAFAVLLKPEGVATFEQQHLLQLMQKNQFDTIYHEHYSYLSLLAAQRIFASAHLRVFDVEHHPTHGGSLRLFVCHQDASHPETAAVRETLDAETAFGLDCDPIYIQWGEQVRRTKRDILKLLIELKDQGKQIAGYGAPAKGNTLLNYCGIGRDFLDFTVDRSPSKQGLFLPGSRLLIEDPDRIFERKPDYVMILPWNLKDEIKEQLAGIRSWGGQFIVPVPVPTIEP